MAQTYPSIMQTKGFITFIPGIGIFIILGTYSMYFKIRIPLTGQNPYFFQYFIIMLMKIIRYLNVAIKNIDLPIFSLTYIFNFRHQKVGKNPLG